MRRRGPTRTTGRSSMPIRSRCSSCRWTLRAPASRPTAARARSCASMNRSARALKKAGAQHGCTLFVTLLAGFEALLSRLSGQEDFVVGVPMAGQALLENGHLVGHCVNMMPLRCRIEPAARFVDHLKSVRHAFLDSPGAPAAHVREPGAQAQCPAGSQPDAARLRHVQHRQARCAVRLRRPRARIGRESAQALRQFRDLDQRRGHGRDLLVECEYNTDLFTSATIGRWLGHYRVLLEAIASDPGQRTDELPLLTEAERRQAISGWNKAVSLSARGHACTSASSGRWSARRTRWRWSSKGERADLRGAEPPRQPAGAPPARARRGPRPARRPAHRAQRSRWWSASSASSRPAAPICRSTRRIPKDRIAFMLEDSRVAVVVTQQESGGRSRRASRSTRVLLDEPLAGRRHESSAGVDARMTSPTSSTPRARPASPRAC